MPRLTLSATIIFNTIIVLLAFANGGIFFLNSYLASSYLEIRFLDVGQGDSIMITTPDKVNMLIDAGKDGAALAEIRKALPIWESIDVLLLTHPDADHVGGLTAVVNAYKPTTVLSNKFSQANSQPYYLFQESIKTLGLNETASISGDVWLLGCCVRIDIVWPLSIPNSDLETNANSMAIHLSYRDFRFLSAGDLGVAQEEQLVKSVPSEVDLLKVSHHGSKTSTSPEFLASILPAHAVIQSGTSNSYGHPATEVLKNLQAAGATVLRNDQLGNITYVTDGFGYKYFAARG